MIYSSFKNAKKFAKNKNIKHLKEKLMILKEIDETRKIMPSFSWEDLMLE